jgi:TRAP-type C4-dicarboxylate transport system substrate-binding protein
MARSLFRGLGANAVPLSSHEVLPSLQTGLIDACYGSPVAMLAFQWWTRVRFMSSLRITYGVGALVVGRRSYEQLPGELRAALAAEAAVLERALRLQVRVDNAQALEKLKRSGIQVIEMPARLRQELESLARRMWPELAAGIQATDLFERARRLLAETAGGQS